MTVTQIHPIERARKIGQWLATPPDEPNPRGGTILMWILIVIASGGVIWGDNQEALDTRHETVCVVKIAFNDLYDFAEELSGPSEDLARARVRLNALFPDDCSNFR